MIKILYLFLKKNPQKFFLRRRMQFGNFATILSPKDQLFLLISRKRSTDCKYHRIIFFPQKFRLDTSGAVLKTMPQVFRQIAKRFCSKFESDKYYLIFWKDLKLLKMFFWTRRMQFWQPCRKSLAKSQNVFTHIPKSINKISISSKKIFSSKKCSGYVEWSFDSRARNFSPKVKKLCS